MLTPCASESLREGPICKNAHDRSRDRLRRAITHQQSGLFVDDLLARAAIVVGNAREADGECFEQRVWAALILADHDKGVELRQMTQRRAGVFVEEHGP